MHLLPNGRTEFSHQQGIGPEIIKKMIVHGDLLDVQEIGENSADFPLDVVRWSHVRLSFSEVARPCWLRQLLAIDLVARKHRQSNHFFEKSRQHVGWKIASYRLDYLVLYDVIDALTHRIVCYEFGHPRNRFKSAHDGLSDSGHFHQNRLYFCEFDAVSADFHLGIYSPEIFDLAGFGNTP